jgi:sterol desaturase/sphingolipid hydroxylase (fatty acid hydroxylase superfamily)
MSPAMNSVMTGWSLLPLFSFLLLLGLEQQAPARHQERAFTTRDWLLNLSGFAMQGLVIPLLGYYLATHLFPAWWPGLKGSLPLGFWGAFWLNFVGIDFLYYWQHRAFHQNPWLWKLHATHHHSPVVNVWATSRNALVTHFLFVYMLVNPVLGYLCNSSEGFFAGAMLTAALDLFRHANIRLNIPVLDGLVMLPQDHHHHHDAERPDTHYGANFLIWDRLFGTIGLTHADSRHEAPSNPPSFRTQLLFPWRA